MEYMSLKEGFITKIICKVINRSIEKRTGIRPNIGVKEVILKKEGNRVDIHFDGSIPADVFERLIEKLI